MRTRIIQPRSRYVIFLVLLAILSCDSFKEDFIHPENQVTFDQTEYYILPGSSVVIDQASIIKESFSNVSLSISQMPTRGELLPLDSLLLKNINRLMISQKDKINLFFLFLAMANFSEPKR